MASLDHDELCSKQWNIIHLIDLTGKWIPDQHIIDQKVNHSHFLIDLHPEKTAIKFYL